MGDLFTEGGKIFWVAPSGGRDRPDESGKFVVAPFDVKVVDTFYLVQRQSGRVSACACICVCVHELLCVRARMGVCLFLCMN
jgi:glycerol-3-phosphate O-acyltransferase